MDAMRAISFPFDDEDWPVKTLIGTFMMIFALIPFLQFVPLGYQAYVARGVMHGNKRPIPGAGDLGQVISDGITVFIGWLIYNLPMILMGCVLGFAGSVLGGSDLGAMLFLCLSLCLGGFMLVLMVFGMIFFSMGMIRFTESGEFSAFLAIGELWSDAREHTGLLLELALYMIGLGLLAGIAISALAVTCIGVPVAIYFWQLASGHLLGQAAQRVARGY